MILSEEYRPEKLDDLVLPDRIYETFKSYIENKDIPNLLLSGPPGTGKTSLAKILRSELTNSSYDSLFINASLERGIDLMRTRIMDFMSSPPLDSPIKIVILDEADNMTPDAFKSLKSLIEDERFKAHNVRFIFTLNDETELIDAIISRLVKFTFDYVPKDKIFSRVKKVLEDKDINYSDEDVYQMVIDLYPDIRKIFNYISKYTGKDFIYAGDSSVDDRGEMINRLITAVAVIEKGGMPNNQDTESFLSLVGKNELLVKQVVVDVLKRIKCQPYTFIIMNRYLNTMNSAVSKYLHLQSMIYEIYYAKLKADKI